MSNTHLIPDSAAETQAILGDLHAPCILSTTWPAVPGASLTLAAFATFGYVRTGAYLRYVSQAAMPVTLSGADGEFWLALHADTSSAVASWTRVPGTHYLWRSNPTKPAEPAGGLILSQVTVAGGIITAVSQATIPRTPLSLQDAGAVAITGGAASLDTLTVPFPGPASINQIFIPDSGGTVAVGINSNVSDGAGTRFNLLAQGTAPNRLTGMTEITAGLGVGQAPVADRRLGLTYTRGVQHGIVIIPTDNTSSPNAIVFMNAAQSSVGGITTTASATSYNTSSDPRLKENIEDLPNPLQVMQGLRPVAFRWRRTQEAGRGLLADEVQALVPEAVTGAADAEDAEGNIIPQMIDYSKLVPYLVGAVKALMALNTVRGNQIQALTARVAALEAAQP